MWSKDCHTAYGMESQSFTEHLYARKSPQALHRVMKARAARFPPPLWGEGTLWHRSGHLPQRTRVQLQMCAHLSPQGGGNDVALLCSTASPHVRGPLLDDHLDHVIAERRVEALRNLVGGRHFLAELELRAVVGGAVNVGVRCNAQPHVRTC